MKTKVQLIATERRENVYEGNRKSVSYICQCVVFGEKMEVGVLRLPLAVVEPYLKDDQLPVGFYEVEYGLSVSFRDRSVEGRVKGVTPVSEGGRSPIGRLSENQQKAEKVAA
jgi:hypothetical protein